MAPKTTDKDVSKDISEMKESLNFITAALQNMNEQREKDNVMINNYTDDQFVNNSKLENGLSIINFNTRSLNAYFEKNQDYLIDLKFSFDVVTITETWMNKSSNVNNFHLNGHEMFHVDRLSRKGGGVAVYINNKFNCKLLNDQCLSIENVCECVTVEICL